MALPDAGVPLSLDMIHVEAGGATGTLCSINDADILALIGKTASTQMGFDEWYGASAEVLLNGEDFEDTARNDTTGVFSNDASSAYGPNAQMSQVLVQVSPTFVYRKEGLSTGYVNTGATTNRWCQATGTITFTNLFNITGVDSSLTGRTLYFEEVAIARNRQSNGSDGTAFVNSRWYQSNGTSAAATNAAPANSTTNSTVSTTTFGGVIGSANNGTASVKMVDALGLGPTSGSATANDAKGMSHDMKYLSSFGAVQNIRIA